VFASLLNLEIALRLLHLASILFFLLILLLGIFANNLLFCSFSFLCLFALAGSFFFTLARSIFISLLTIAALLIFIGLALLFFICCLLCGRLFLFALLVSLDFGKFLLATLLINGGLFTTFVFALGLLLAFFLAFLLVDAENLHHVGSSVDACGSSSKHLLQEEVRVFGLVASDDLRWFAVDLLAYNQLCQLKQLHKPVDLRLLFGD